MKAMKEQIFPVPDRLEVHKNFLFTKKENKALATLAKKKKVSENLVIRMAFALLLTTLQGSK